MNRLNRFLGGYLGQRIGKPEKETIEARREKRSQLYKLS
jgi:hypothetical protein